MNNEKSDRLSASPAFHISRWAREFYELNPDDVTPFGTILVPSFHSARSMVQKINDRKDLIVYPERALFAGEINALALLSQILEIIFDTYLEQSHHDRLGAAALSLDERVGEDAVNQVFAAIAAEFLPSPDSLGPAPRDDTYRMHPERGAVRSRFVKKLVLLYIQNENPAAHRLHDLFDDERLEHETDYGRCIDALDEYFRGQSGFGSQDESILDMLREPARRYPNSLARQLEYIISTWGGFLGSYLYRLLSALDLIQEEESRMAGPGPAEAPFEKGFELDEENYSRDSTWMPELVLLAKSIFVWLHQLSRKYDRDITTLDDIPDEELDRMARIGFSGLWLIGVWERSDASRRIKQYSGDADATSSAYSVFDYTVAHNLGGEDAIDRLRQRCLSRGIRLAADVVPNHTGIDSKWIGDHPEWFLSLDHSPFPAYSFTGADLSSDSRYSVYLEDHYYERTDAAVVFKHVDHGSGTIRYIYHGNDGTMMPWNDTAQLNYLHPAVPEAMIDTIIRIARQFPVIRFDAAMTLTRRHYQRLWFPHPGEGGAIPTRAEHGLTHEEFNTRMPVEFWRRVVDRIAAEAPDTLLLAEAFWLTESYFVRTLGMHRVYNSAFMNMLRDEENARYRKVITDTLEYDPEILKRFVNFMNNPDEETAVAQFGKGDKYFGICVLMVTLPGLPMFGHGQVEGLQEKYGVEFLRPRMDESEDQGFMEHHMRVISPLLKRRRMFAGVDRFNFYDFRGDSGSVDQDVFAYSNGDDTRKGVVVYNNSNRHTAGAFDRSLPKLIRTDGGSRMLESSRFVDVFDLEPSAYSIFRDGMTGLEHIYPNREIQDRGMRLELGPYGCMVLMDHRQVHSTDDRPYDEVSRHLAGRGVPSIEEALYEMPLIAIHDALRGFLDDAFLHAMEEYGGGHDEAMELRSRFVKRLEPVVDAIDVYIGGDMDRDLLMERAGEDFETILMHPEIFPSRSAPAFQRGETFPFPRIFWSLILVWLGVRRLGMLRTEDSWRSVSRSWIDELRLSTAIRELLGTIGFSTGDAAEIVDIVRILVTRQNWFHDMMTQRGTARALRGLFRDTDVTDYLRINRYHDVLWFNRERFEKLLFWLGLVSLFHRPGQSRKAIDRSMNRIMTLAEAAGFRVTGFFDLLEEETVTPGEARSGKTHDQKTEDNGLERD